MPAMSQNCELGKLECVYQHLGCSASFKTVHGYKDHILGCVYSFVDSCQEEGCFKRPMVKFQNFNDLVGHYSEVHGSGVFHASPSERAEIIFRLNQDFFTDTNNGLRAKHVGRIEWEEEKEFYRVALVCLSRGISTETGNPLFNMAPVLYFKTGEPIAHWIQLQLTLSNSDDEPLRTKEEGAIQDEADSDKHSRMISCRALHSITDVIDEVEQDGLVYFDIGDTWKQKNLHSYTFKLQVVPKGFRCKAILQSTIPLISFALNWSDIGVSHVVQENLEVVMNAVPDEVTLILGRQIGQFADLIVECNDTSGLLNACTTILMNYAFVMPKEPGPRKPIAVVLFPTHSSLMARQRQWRKRINRTGLTVSLTDVNDPEELDSFKTHGCDVLLTTPTLFHAALSLKGDPLSKFLTSYLKFVILLDADLAKEDDDLISFHRCMRQLPLEIHRSVHRTAVCPLLRNELVQTLYRRGFPHLCNLLSVGRGPKFLTENMALNPNVIKKTLLDVEEIISIISMEKKNLNIGRYAVFVNEDEDKDEDEVASRLKVSFNDKRRVLVMKQDGAHQNNRQLLAQFKETKNGILVTSFFAMNYSVLKYCSVLILYKKRDIDGNLIRLSSYYMRNQQSTLKLIYGYPDADTTFNDIMFH